MSELIISPSRVKEAARCLRYWAFKKLAHIAGEETQPMRDGKAAHSIAEAYLKHGTIPDARSRHGRWVVEGIPLLPKPHTSMVEHRVVRFEWAGMPWTVVFDCVHLQSRTKLDHKFIAPGSFPFTFTPITLLDDAQALLNVIAPPQFPITNLRWVYYPKSGGRKPWAVDAQITIAQAEENFRHLHLPVCREMHTYHKLFAGVHEDDKVELCNAVPCTTTACFDYHKPCEYMAICKR